MQDIFTFSLESLESLLNSFKSILSLDVFLKIILAYSLIIWLACAVWVIKDITTRTTSIFVQVFAILLIILFTPIFGLPIYLLIRPRTTLFEQYYEETSLETLESEEIEQTRCKHCQLSIHSDAVFCPHCGTAQWTICKKCGAKMAADWQFCAACGHSQKQEVSPVIRGVEKVKSPKKGVPPPVLTEDTPILSTE